MGWENKYTITIRQLRIDEIKLLVDCRISFLKEIQGLQNSENIKKLGQQLEIYFQKALSDNSYIGFVAEIGNRPVGFGGMVVQQVPGNFLLMKGLKGYILNIYTMPAYRKSGIGSKIIEHIIAEGRKLGLDKIYLHATQAGVEIYRQKGFIEPEYPEFEYIY